MKRLINLFCVLSLTSLKLYSQNDSLNNNSELYFNLGLSSNINNRLNKEIVSSDVVFNNCMFGFEYYAKRAKISFEANRMFYIEIEPVQNNPIATIKQLSQLGINYWIVSKKFHIGTYHSWASFGSGQLYKFKSNKVTHYPERGIGLKLGYLFKNGISIAVQSHYLYDSYNGVKIGPDIENTYLCLVYKFSK